MTASTLEFWFEFASTYSYVAAERVEELARAASVDVRWRPFLLGPIFKAQGWNDSPFNIYEAKGRYMWRDLARVCQKHGLPFRRPSAFPRNGLFAARVATAGESEAWLPEFVRGVYRANFEQDLDTSSPDVVERALELAGCRDVEAVLARAGSGEIKERLRERTSEAASRGVFGAPSFFVENELFWGNDRLEDAIAWCQRGRV